MAASEASAAVKVENSLKNKGPDNVHAFKAVPAARNAPTNRRGGGNGGPRGGPRGGGGGGRGRGDSGRGMGPPGNRPARPANNSAPSVASSEVSHASRNTANTERSRQYIESDFQKRLRKIEGPTTSLGSVDTTEKEFNNRCRLYIGNLPAGTTEDDVKEIFAPYGKIGEFFVNPEKMFGFVRLDTRANAERARQELDGQVKKGRPLRVRFSYANSAIRVRNLNPLVTNELLEWGFQVFGEIERAVVICDERGKSTGEGIVEYSKKPGAVFALKKCTEGAYFLSRSLQPVIVEAYEPTDDSEGFPEKNLFKNSNDFHEERSVGPWFAEPGSFEAQYAQRWKEHFAQFKEKFDQLKFEQKTEQEKLIAKMDFARYEHETERLRQQLMERENLREKQKLECEMLEKRAEEQKRLFEENLRKQEEQRAQAFQLRQRQDDFRRNEPFEAGFNTRGNQDNGNDFIPGIESIFGRRDILFGNGHRLGNAEPAPLMDAFEGRNARPDNRSRWSAPQGDRRGMPMNIDDGPHMKRRRY